MTLNITFSIIVFLMSIFLGGCKTLEINEMVGDGVPDPASSLLVWNVKDLEEKYAVLDRRMSDVGGQLLIRLSHNSLPAKQLSTGSLLLNSAEIAKQSAFEIGASHTLKYGVSRALVRIHPDYYNVAFCLLITPQIEKFGRRLLVLTGTLNQKK